MSEYAENEPLPDTITLADGSIVDKLAATNIAECLYTYTFSATAEHNIETLHRFRQLIDGHDVTLSNDQSLAVNNMLNTGLFRVGPWVHTHTPDTRHWTAISIFINMIHTHYDPECNSIHLEVREPFSEPGFLERRFAFHNS